MKINKHIVTNWLKASPAVVRNRDGSCHTVSAFTTTADGNIYCFKYPYVQRDFGSEVPPQYVEYNSFFGNIYVWLALKAVKIAPHWITY